MPRAALFVFLCQWQPGMGDQYFFSLFPFQACPRLHGCQTLRSHHAQRWGHFVVCLAGDVIESVQG